VTVSSGDEHAPPEELLEHLRRVTLELSEAEGLQETLQRIVDLGEDLLVHCDGVSLMLISKGGRIETPAYSSQAARDSDMAQYQTGEGPCLEAIKDHRTIVIDDLRTDERWPHYRARALELGVRSMISFRLFVTGDSMGALDMSSREPHAFDQRSQLVGQVFAAQASVAMKAALTQAGLEAALGSRDVIGQAKGIVMARSRMTAHMAADTLKRLSQDRNQPLRELAAQIAETGEVPNG
jgi:transcriptional regulator with GAF, ATPase, and Fis domain